MPRRYSMERRSAIVDETRQRIIDATVALHAEKGVSSTSMQDIAARAGVSLGTVYRHFPTMDELIPACGGRNMELAPPPTPQVLEGVEGEERVNILFRALYAHYEAAERPYFVGYAEGPKLPVLQRFMDEVDAYVRSLVTDAVTPLHPSEHDLGLAIAMADYHTWHAFHRAGFDTTLAAATAADMVTAQLTNEQRMK